MYAATRSPSDTPSALSPAAIAAVCARSSPQVHEASGRSSEACWIASAVVALAAENVLGVIDPCPREPLGARHRAAAEHTRRRPPEPQLEILDDRGPERVDIRHRPAPQVLVALRTSARACARPTPGRPSASRGAPAREMASREAQGLSSPGVFRSSLARRMLGMSSTKQQTAPAGQRRGARRHHAPRPGRSRDPARRPVARPPRGAGLATPLRLNLLQGPRGAVASRP